MSYQLAKEVALREERIQAYMEANKYEDYAALKSTRGYCEALVDGEDAVKAKNHRLSTKEINAIWKANRASTEQILKQMEKKTMTRDEAIETVFDLMPGSSKTECERWVDMFRKLGMLKVEEPKTVLQRLNDMIKDRPICDSSISGSIIMYWVDEAGLKIVEK